VYAATAARYLEVANLKYIVAWGVGSNINSGPFLNPALQEVNSIMSFGRHKAKGGWYTSSKFSFVSVKILVSFS